MTKQDLVKAIGTYGENDLIDVLEVLEIINGERINNQNFNDVMTWSCIKGAAKGYREPRYAYAEVFTHDNTLTAMITKSIDEMKLKGYAWHDTQYQTVSNNGVIVHSALLIFKKF